MPLRPVIAATLLLAVGSVGCAVDGGAPPGGLDAARDASAGADEAAVAAPAGWPTPPPAAWEATVTHLTDGDTLWVTVGDRAPEGHGPGDELKLRLLRIDTPELGRDGRADECLAVAAREHLADLVPVGSRVLAAHDVERRDRYGRELVHLWSTDGRWVNGAMLADGFARVVTFPPNVAHTDAVLAAERSAREAGRGLWSADAC